MSLSRRKMLKKAAAAGGASLIEILNALCDTIDAQAPGIISTATRLGRC